MRYEWYEEVSESDEITQGDILLNCPVAIMNKDSDISSGQVDAEITYVDGIILTQACDLKQGKVDSVLICGLISKINTEKQLKESGKTENKIKDWIQSIVKGKVTSKHIINNYNSDTYKQDYYIIDFTSVYTIPLDIAKKVAKENNIRLRLCPPYREHLSQAFARFFMRVGLPVDIEIYPKN